jgi:hypothetical protein
MFLGLCSVAPRRMKALPMETETLRKPCGLRLYQLWRGAFSALRTADRRFDAP